MVFLSSRTMEPSLECAKPVTPGLYNSSNELQAEGLTHNVGVATGQYVCSRQNSPARGKPSNTDLVGASNEN